MTSEMHSSSNFDIETHISNNYRLIYKILQYPAETKSESVKKLTPDVKKNQTRSKKAL